MIALRVYCCRMLVLPFERWFWFIASGDISWKSPSNSNTFKVVRVFSHVPLKIDLQSIYSTFSYCVTTNWCHQNRNYILFKFGKFAKLNSKWLHFRCGLFQSKSPTYLLSFWYVQIEWWSDPVIIAITFDTETLFDLRSKSIYSIPTLRLCRAQSRFVCKYTEPFSAILVARRESRWRFSSQMSFWNHCMWFSRTPIHSWPPRNFCVVHVMSCMYTIAIAASNGSLAVCNPDNFHPNQRQNETEPRKKNIVHARGKYIHTRTHTSSCSHCTNKHMDKCMWFSARHPYTVRAQKILFDSRLVGTTFSDLLILISVVCSKSNGIALNKKFLTQMV